MSHTIMLEEVQQKNKTSDKPIYIVEDDPTLRDLVVEVLTEEFPDWHCIALESGAAALLVAPQPPPALLILDYLLLGEQMTGIQVYDRLHERAGWQAIPAILWSATPPWNDIQQRNLIGLIKPCDLDRLLSLVASLLV